MTDTSIDPNEFKATARSTWAEAAPGWRKWAHAFETAAKDLNEKLVQLAGVEPGHRVLDVASGMGEPALTVARRAGPNGRVVATDLSDAMLGVARERAKAAGIGNLETREMDAENLELEPSSFDAATCRWGVMLLLDPVAACRGVHRALKPGARFAAAVWGEAARVPFLAIPHAVAVREANLPPPPPGTPGPLVMGKPGLLEATLEAAGFKDLRTETVSVVFEFASPKEYGEYLHDLSGMLRKLLEEQPPDVRARVRQGIERAAQAHLEANGRVRLVNESRCVSGAR
jgi:SAM-dependent methyltransferase